MEKLKCVRNNNSFKDQSFIDARSSADHPKDNNNLGDFAGGFSWPPRSYTCTFCKREFRSAQALGGHMNVHRRDRARVRQMVYSQSFCSNYNNTLFKLNLEPNPNFSHHFSSNLSSTSTILSSLTSKQPNLNYPSSRLCGNGGENESKTAKNLEIVRWNFEASLVGESKSDDLDLELRLGCF